MTLPFSQACENNKTPILAALRPRLADPGLVLEIGTGTGQHAVHFAAALPHLQWQPSDQPDALGASAERLRAAELANLRPALTLDVAATPWPIDRADAVFSANTAHIMSWPQVCAMFAGVAALLGPRQPFLLYGPFHQDGRATSASNAGFDQQLRARDPAMGIRDRGDLEALGDQHGLALMETLAMPANNQLLVWRRLA
ncbi:MAG: DUF938 domain-containing protein [Marinobacter sp.]|uniref:DUF938 domain-containing protein n=1 Tax=Marinobacter sp. TaxID=50741 RepID=UPI00299CD789|nr:DUF938 domain-containing protein [Marinobacter sp.]MDX1633555.1 DUF938 domain-containing protein [Marinobacter sp.]